jgi:hypothetical protein
MSSFGTYVDSLVEFALAEIVVIHFRIYRRGDVALGYGAQAYYHVPPEQTFVDAQGRTVRFADRSGSNPKNSQKS